MEKSRLRERNPAPPRISCSRNSIKRPYIQRARDGPPPERGQIAPGRKRFERLRDFTENFLACMDQGGRSRLRLCARIRCPVSASGRRCLYPFKRRPRSHAICGHTSRTRFSTHPPPHLLCIRAAPESRSHAAYPGGPLTGRQPHFCRERQSNRESRYPGQGGLSRRTPDTARPEFGRR